MERGIQILFFGDCAFAKLKIFLSLVGFIKQTPNLKADLGSLGFNSNKTRLVISVRSEKMTFYFLFCSRIIRSSISQDFNNNSSAWLCLVCQRNVKLQVHNFKRKLSWDTKISQQFNFFSIWVSFCRHWRFKDQQGKGV